MERATFVINVLEDSNRRSIEYENKRWLYDNVYDMNIRVHQDNCNVDIQKIREVFYEKGTIVIQNGEIIKTKSDFNSRKEALLVCIEGSGYNYVFQYFPKKKK